MLTTSFVDHFHDFMLLSKEEKGGLKLKYFLFLISLCINSQSIIQFKNDGPFLSVFCYQKIKVHSQP